MFQDNSIDTYTDVVISYISKRIDEVIPRITFLNQKPCVNGEFHARLTGKHRPTLKTLEEYRKSRYALWRAISSVKKQHRDKVESYYQGSSSRNMLARLRTITDYKRKTSSTELMPSSADMCKSFKRINPHKAPGPDAAPVRSPHIFKEDHHVSPKHPKPSAQTTTTQ